jgi:CysZ protein
MLTNFFKGVHYFLNGFVLVRQPELWRFVWVPMVCNIVLFAVLVLFVGYWLSDFSQWLTHNFPIWLQWLKWLVLLSGLIFSSIILIYVSTFLVNLIAGPFNSMLAEKVLEYLKFEKRPHDIPLLEAIPVTFSRQMHFLSYYIPRAIFYLILFVVPLAQAISTVLWFLFNGWVFTMQYLDYPMDLYGISIKHMRKIMAQNKGLCMGFGAAIMFFAMIPLVNFIIIPVSVAGAALMFAREFPELKKDNRNS